jgi:BASS family bile acid:Na+ symporter
MLQWISLAASFSGYGLSRLFRVNDTERISLMYGLGMNNNGTGLVLVSLLLADYPRGMAPIIFYNLVQHLVAGGAHEVIGRKVEDQKAANS